MYLVESDLTYSLSSLGRHHETAKAIFKAAIEKTLDLSVSSLCFQEIDLLIKSKIIELGTTEEEFFDWTTGTLKEYGINEAEMKPADAAQSIRFRKKYGLTFFDSYYAAQAYRLQRTLVSFDEEYAKVKEIEYKHPEEILEELG
ncbi:PIN domain-containing protein [Candidatus Micrarchaeota archaeon]|nr:PIN domain-containing protein [Candidatus Micrarchaeota archaeon]